MVACTRYPLYRNLAFLDIHGCISVWDLDHIGDFADELDTEAFQNVSSNAFRVVACARLTGGVDYVTAVTDRLLDVSYYEFLIPNRSEIISW